MSSTRSVELVTKTLTAPPVPAGTMAALALMRPSNEFSVEARGCGCPLGHMVRYPRDPWGTTVTFREYADALEGTPQALFGMTKSRDAPPTSEGPASGPLGAFRVSATRQGVIGTKRSAVVGMVGLIAVMSLAFALTDPPPDTLTWLVTCEGAFGATFTVTVIAA